MLQWIIRTGLLVGTLFLAVGLHAQLEDPVTWTFRTETEPAGTNLHFDAVIDDGWSVYSQYLESDDGPAATEITYETLGGANLQGKSRETGDRKTGYDALFGMNVTKFAHKYGIVQPVTFKGAERITGYLTYMVCNDEMCLPPTDVEFVFTAPKAAAIEAQQRDLAAPETTDPSPIPESADRVVAQTSEISGTTAVPSTPAGQQAATSENTVVEVGTNEFITPVTWSIAARDLGNQEVELSLTAAIKKGWNIYGPEPVEDGPIATTLVLAPGEHVERLGEVSVSGKRKELYDTYFGMDVVKYLAPTATFSQRLRLLNPRQPVLGFVEFMTCDDEQCLPPEEVPFVYEPATKTARIIEYTEYDRLSGAASGTPENTVVGADPLSSYTIDKSNADVTCGTDLRETEVASNDGWLTVFLLGFGGGLLALLTPCVFPMIPLTVSFFTARGTDRKRGLQRALLYGLSIIAIYVVLGLVITGLFGADALNLLSTNAWFNLAFGILFVVFAFSFFGFFEITLPSSWANKSDQAADQGGILGIFFIAFTLSLVSFSCTGPIIGTLLVETATGGGVTILGRIPVAPLMGMLGFSTALALPFTLFAAFPTALNALPKSGGWMNTVKVTLGFAEIALAMKFFSTADLIAGTKLLPYELFIAIWLLCSFGLAAYYFGWLKTPLERYGAQKKTVALTGLGVVAVAFGIYVLGGYRVNERAHTFKTPAVLSGLAPPAGHSYIYPKDCPQNLDCFKDYDAGLAYAAKVNKPVLLDFTGHACQNCRKMEDNVWGEPEVYEHLKNDYVLVSLYVDEREELPEPIISDYSGKKLRTVGNKWADFQARYFNRNSQPYYVLMTADGKVLNQPTAYTPDVSEYEAFLECGLREFKRLNEK